MNSNEERKDRQMIPRWLPWQIESASAPEEALLSLRRRTSLNDPEFYTKVARWNHHGTTAAAIDLVVSALLSGHRHDGCVKAAAEFILADSEGQGQSTSIIAAQSVLGFSETHIPSSYTNELNLRRRIADLKSISQSRQGDALVYQNLAYYYSLLGQYKQAKQNLSVALGLAPNHPQLLRSAARFFLHTEDLPDKSLRILRNARVVRHDPMVLAAEIAVSELGSQRSRHKKLARELLYKGDFHPYYLSELAGVVGTFEAQSGSRRKARDAFRLSAQWPTENALAHLQWVMPKLHLDVPVSLYSARSSFEAKTLVHLQAKEYRDALASAKKWVAYQPISVRASSTVSHIASVILEDYDEATAILSRSVCISPQSFALRNDLAFAFACAGELDKAQEQIEATIGMNLDQSRSAVQLATLGLIEFRRGRHEEGRNLYEQAERSFLALHKKQMYAAAIVFHAREEILADTAIALDIGTKALEAASKNDFHDFAALDFVETRLPEYKEQ